MDPKVWLVIFITYIGNSVSASCQEGHLEAITGNCFEYKICKENQWRIFSCSLPHQVFVSSEEKCVLLHNYCLSHKRSTQLCARSMCKQLRMKESVRKTTDSRFYSEFVNGAWIEVERKENETVKNRKCSKGTCLISQNSECRDGEADGVQGSCKKYKKCMGGSFVDKECDKCQNFDEKRSKCMFIWDKPCTEDRPFTSTTSSPLKCLPGTKKPDYHKCTRYFLCNKEGYWENKSCWWFFFFKFDVDSNSCKFWTAKCARK